MPLEKLTDKEKNMLIKLGIPLLNLLSVTEYDSVIERRLLKILQKIADGLPQNSAGNRRIENVMYRPSGQISIIDDCHLYKYLFHYQGAPFSLSMAMLKPFETVKVTREKKASRDSFYSPVKYRRLNQALVLAGAITRSYYPSNGELSHHRYGIYKQLEPLGYKKHPSHLSSFEYVKKHIKALHVVRSLLTLSDQELTDPYLAAKLKSAARTICSHQTQRFEFFDQASFEKLAQIAAKQSVLDNLTSLKLSTVLISFGQINYDELGCFSKNVFASLRCVMAKISTELRQAYAEKMCPSIKAAMVHAGWFDNTAALEEYFLWNEKAKKQEEAV